MADITPFPINDGIQYEAIVLPSTFAIGDMVITFKIGNNTFAWKNPTIADGKLEAGKEYIYTMTINRTGINFECTIQDWTTVNRSGTAS